MEIRRAISEYFHRGTDLYHQLRSSEDETLTAVDLYVLKAQLFILNVEVDRLRRLQQTVSQKADSSKHDRPTQ